MKHYLDYNATAPLRPEVQAVMQEWLAWPLNASSVHALGRRAKAVVEDARRVVGEALGAFANEVVFTGSGTEANNWALQAFGGGRIFVSAVEHASVLKTARAGAGCVVIPVTAQGVVDVDALDSLLSSRVSRHPERSEGSHATRMDEILRYAQDEGAGRGRLLVSIMLANNETGVIQPVADIAKIVHAHGGLLHCDAVQGLGKIPVDFTALGCDLLTVSGHKMGGPVGAAALVVRNNLPIKPMLTGGGQELNRRAGTENVAAIAGFAKAVELMNLESMHQLRQWHQQLEAELCEYAPGAVVAGAGAARLPNTTCISMPDAPAETQLISFDLAGIAVSAGSACSSGRIEGSHVLRAMGWEESVSASCIRISSGWASTQEDFTALKTAWKKLYRLKHPDA